MFAKLKALWQRAWTMELAGLKAIVAGAVLLVDGAADLLGDTNVQAAVHQYVPDAKWGICLAGIAVLTYISAAHRGKA